VIIRLRRIIGSTLVASSLLTQSSFAQDINPIPSNEGAERPIKDMIACLQSQDPTRRMAGLGLASIITTLNGKRAIVALNEVMRVGTTLTDDLSREIYLAAVQNLIQSILSERDFSLESGITLGQRFRIVKEDLPVLLKPVQSSTSPAVRRKLLDALNKISAVLIDDGQSTLRAIKLLDRPPVESKENVDPLKDPPKLDPEVDPVVRGFNERVKQRAEDRKLAPETVNTVLALTLPFERDSDPKVQLLALQTVQNLANYLVKLLDPSSSSLEASLKAEKIQSQMPSTEDAYADLLACESTLVAFGRHLTEILPLLNSANPDIVKQTCSTVEQIGIARKKAVYNRDFVRRTFDKAQIQGTEPVGTGLSFILPTVSRLAKSPDASIRLAVIEALEPYGKAAWSGRSIVTNLANDPVVVVRWVVARALSDLILDDAPFTEKQECYVALAKLCNDPDIDVRITAFNSAKNLKANFPTLDDAILTACTRGDDDARIEALLTLPSANVSPEKAVPILSAALKNPSVRIRWNAAKAFQSYGPKAIAGVESLKLAMFDPDEGVRSVSAAALAAVTR
jgi:hypothetical protein